MRTEIILNAQNSSDDAESDLNLNTDIIHNRSKTYHSLSDLYGIQLFTDERVERMGEYEKYQKKQEKSIRENIFVKKSEHKGNDENLVENLFQERMVIVMDQSYEKETEETQIFFLTGIILICLVFGALWGKYWKDKKRRNAEEESSYEQ